MAVRVDNAAMTYRALDEASAGVAGLLQASGAGAVTPGSTVVCTLTGHGLKDPDTAVAGVRAPATIGVDVVAAAAAISPVPVAAYQVSGEYAMICAAAANNWIDARAAALESLTSIRRAGADIVLSYWAADAADWLS